MKATIKTLENIRKVFVKQINQPEATQAKITYFKGKLTEINQKIKEEKPCRHN